VRAQRLRGADWLAWLAALVLVCSLALDWYSTRTGEEARRVEQLAEPSDRPSGQAEQEIREEARIVAEGEERNAFQPAAAIDRVVLVVLIAAALLAFAGVIARAAGGGAGPSLQAAALAAGAGTALVAYRMVQEPGLDVATTVKPGALVALLAAGVLALAARAAAQAEPEPRARGREEAAA
jgi:hypothetical protein